MNEEAAKYNDRRLEHYKCIRELEEKMTQHSYELNPTDVGMLLYHSQQAHLNTNWMIEEIEYATKRPFWKKLFRK